MAYDSDSAAARREGASKESSGSLRTSVKRCEAGIMMRVKSTLLVLVPPQAALVLVGENDRSRKLLRIRINTTLNHTYIAPKDF